MNKPIEENLKIVLDFVERWNKLDGEEDVAQACVELEEDILIKPMATDYSKEEQIKDIFERNTEVVKTKIKNGELWESFVFTDGLAKELSNLLTQQRKEGE